MAKSDPPQESPDDKNIGRLVLVQYFWIVVAFGVPFTILGLVSGFGQSFRSGEASTFVCGAIVAGIGENLIELIKNGFSELKGLGLRAWGKTRTGQGWAWLYLGWNLGALGVLGWNLYFAVQNKTVRYSTVDWVQVIAFVYGTNYTALARFSADSIKLLREMFT